MTTAAPPPPTSTVPVPTTVAEPALGLSGTPHCQGCGQPAPAHLAIEAFQSGGDSFPGMVFSDLQWHGWGGPQATAETDAYFGGPGEYRPVILFAFDLGNCHGSRIYRAVEWPGHSFDPSSYFDTCTGEGVGQGWGTPTTTTASCAQHSGSYGTIQICPGTAAIGATVTISGRCQNLAELVFLGPRSYVGSGGGGDDIPVQVDAQGNFSVAYRIPTTYVSGGDQNQWIPVTPGSYEIGSYPADVCSVPLIVTSGPAAGTA